MTETLGIVSEVRTKDPVVDVRARLLGPAECRLAQNVIAEIFRLAYSAKASDHPSPKP